VAKVAFSPLVMALVQ